MTEADSDFFFGRARETVEVIRALEANPDKLPLLLGNSGVGKSSLAQAGVISALARQGWPNDAAKTGPWPPAFANSRQWCFLTLRPGAEPVKALVDSFIRTWRYDATDPAWEERRFGWIERLVARKATLPGLLDATERRHQELGQPKPPAFFLYLDQGEELYVRAEERQRHHFSEIVACGFGDPRLRAMMSMRADFFGDLMQDEALYAIHRLIKVPPLREAQLREVVSRPAELLTARFETDGLVDTITRRTTDDTIKDVGALPLLSYTLDDMWKHMIERGDGVLRLAAQSFELGNVLVDRADVFLADHPKSHDELRRIFTLKLATVREGEEPTRRRASRSEFTEEEWRLVSELADHPNRLLVTATPEGGETYAEVAHEAIFRHWGRLKEWIAAEREFLAWKTGLEAARRTWTLVTATPKGRESHAEVAHEAIFRHWGKLKQWIAAEREFLVWRTGLEAALGTWTSKGSESDALLMGAALTQAKSWFAKRREDLSVADREFIDQSVARESKARARARRAQALIYVLFVGIIVGLLAVINEAYVKEVVNWYWAMRPYRLANFDDYVLKPEEERALKPKQAFRECAKYCPEMIVVPAGGFLMGSLPSTEKGHKYNEFPRHAVTIVKRFAVSRFAVTFADWDVCVSVGGCPQEGLAHDIGWGRGTRPVIHVSWDDAHAYVAWLSKMTGKVYRLLSEAEWEYAARAGSTTAYFWGDEIGKNHANCRGCGSQWDIPQTSPVESFKPNDFGLHDMAGNVWQWVQDCYHDNYSGAPADGSAWISGDCWVRVVRGGSWSDIPEFLRSAGRYGKSTDIRDYNLGFRVGRTLLPP
jgi:formylglycine-generating enzyme required for sulfatase activity